MIRSSAERDLHLDALSTFKKVTGRSPRIYDGKWDYPDLEVASALGLKLPKPSYLIREFGGIQAALRALDHSKLEHTMLLTLVCVRITLGEYPYVVVADELIWDEQTTNLCKATALKLETPIRYAETFQSLKLAIVKAESLRKTL